MSTLRIWWYPLVLFSLVRGDIGQHSQDKNYRLEDREFQSLPDSPILDARTANDFFRRRRVRRDLWEECYDEGCDYEEVEESLSGHALYQYYFGWRCKQAFGAIWTYSGNGPHSGQCSNGLQNMKVCSSGGQGHGIGSSRNCYFGSRKVIYAIYMENGCNDGELASWRLNFDDPGNSVREVHNVGCRERKDIGTVRGASYYKATMIGGGGGDRHVSNMAIGWIGYDAKYCGDPGSPANGGRRGSNFYEMGRVDYYCHSGHALVGASYRICRWYGWESSVPTCKRHCAQGHYSSTGYEPCHKCAVGYYQQNFNQRSCIQCPSGKSTSSTGSRYPSDCHYKCQEAVCTLQQWTAWADMAQPVNGHCASQSRRRVYSKTWRQILDPNGCHNVAQTCPSDIVDTREKVIYCPKLSVPQYGHFSPASCSSQQQACKVPCTLYCNSGFERQGTAQQARRVCQPNGQWSFSDSYCKDVTPPTIQCPNNLELNNDPRRPHARVTLPSPTAHDNSGEAPAITISPSDIQPIHDFGITTSGAGTQVTYIATDNAGLKASCSFFVKVKDSEKPEVLTCPTNVTLFTSKNPVRVVWNPPTFKDNFDTHPTITSTMKPGASLRWGIHKNVYNATDKAGNRATCKFEIQLGPVKCRFYDAPANGARACNIKTSGVDQEFICTVLCQGNSEFVPAAQWDSYMCKSDGSWYGLIQNSFTPIRLPIGQPWPNCAPKSSPTSVAKAVTVYAGSCSSQVSGQGEEQIKQNFLKAVNSDFLLKQLLCLSSQGVDCQLKNVKVYCGKNNSKRRKRGLSESSYVITFEIDVQDLNPAADEAAEKTKLEGVANDLDNRESDIAKGAKKAAAAAVSVAEDQVDVEDKKAAISCPAGKIAVTKKGAGSDILRSDCVKCSVGTYYDVATRTCVACPLGTYQNEEGKENCKKCPGGQVTQETQSRDISDCLDVCGPGEHSPTGLATCDSCPIGSYQSANRSTSCLPCPAGTSTLHTATTSAEECKRYCGPGLFALNGLGACLPCPRGSYQPESKGTTCLPCPADKTTLGDGATKLCECVSHCDMDFESGVGSWQKTGTAFNNQPTYGDNSKHRGAISANQQGDWWMGTYENRPMPSDSEGGVQGDSPVGTITSDEFTINSNALSFLIGGGCDVNTVRAELEVDGKVVRKATGKCSEKMERRQWGVSEFLDKSGRLRLVDNASGGWGHINFDDFRGVQCNSRCVMDFENGGDKWARQGTAFNNQPTYGDNPTHRGRETAQQQGDWWIGGYEDRPSPSHAAGQTQTDTPQGTMTSPAFTIRGSMLSFLIGGGCDVTKVRAELVVDGKVVRQETGKCFETMVRRQWHVTEFKGKMAHVRLVDQSSGGWGHINFDDLRGNFCL